MFRFWIQVLDLGFGFMFWLYVLALRFGLMFWVYVLSFRSYVTKKLMLIQVYRPCHLTN